MGQWFYTKMYVCVTIQRMVFMQISGYIIITRISTHMNDDEYALMKWGSFTQWSSILVNVATLYYFIKYSKWPIRSFEMSWHCDRFVASEKSPLCVATRVMTHLRSSSYNHCIVLPQVIPRWTGHRCWLLQSNAKLWYTGCEVFVSLMPYCLIDWPLRQVVIILGGSSRGSNFKQV